MEWSKIKNIILLVLLVVNGFLLALAAARWGGERRAEQTALAQAVQVLEQSGIAVSESAVDDASGLTARTLERDTEVEAALAAALLDEEVSGSNLGGGVYQYAGARGAVTLRAGGELSAELGEDARWETDDPEAHAARLLKDMGLEGKLVETERDGETVSLTFRQLWDGAPVFSCRLTFTYSGGRLTGLSGTAALGSRTAAEQGELLTRATALLRFLDSVLDSKDVCSTILSMEAGYRTAQDFAGAVKLTPVWLISSNTADYYLDAATGAVTRVSD